jgi:hypothetical protein
MTSFLRAALAGVLVLLLAGCASVDPETYRAEKPVLELDRYFNGVVDGWGMFSDRSGKVVTRFSVIIRATWNGDTGTLDEDFTYADGRKEKRVWTIKKLPGGNYTGTAGDVVGTARGVAAGNALNWRYVLDLKIGERNYHVNFDDWMFLLDDDVMLNRAEMSKFGFRLGEVTLAFRKRR